MLSLHEQGIAALGLALQARTEALLRSLQDVFEEHSLHAALQARRQLAELRAMARFCGNAALQQQCVGLQRALLALGPRLSAGVPEVETRPLLLQALQLRWQALALTQTGLNGDAPAWRAARLAPELSSLLLQQVQRLLREHALTSFGAANGNGSWEAALERGPVSRLDLPALQAVARLAGVLPERVLLTREPLHALLHWESHLLGPEQQPRARLMRALALRLHRLCEETAAPSALRQSLETRDGPWSERLLLCLQHSSVLLRAFVGVPQPLWRCLQQALRVSCLLQAWQRVPVLAATALSVALAPLQLRLLLRLQDDLARLAGGNAPGCAGLQAAALAASTQSCLRQQRPLAARQVLEQILGVLVMSRPALVQRWRRLLQQEHIACLRVLEAWQVDASGQSPAPVLDDGVTLAVQRLTQESLLAGDLALHELLEILGRCLTLSRELQHDARDCLPALRRVLPFVQNPARRWQRERVLNALLRWEAGLRLQAGSESAQLALSLARGLKVLPALQLLQELLQEQLAQSRQLDEDLHAAAWVHPARLAPRLRRVLEDTAHRQGKVARLEIRAVVRRVPRSVLESLVPPLEHLLRNAVVHGLESPTRRRACGKHECGRVRVLVSASAGVLQVGVEDDGCGLASGEHAVAFLGADTGGPWRPESAATLDAGHGLGLAAVQAAMAALQGRVRVVATPGQGCCYWLEMPENSGLGDHHAMPV